MPNNQPYYESLGLKRDPFPEIAELELFYSSGRHGECLDRIERSLWLKKGLHLVQGKAGTGKSLICSELLEKMGEDPDVKIFYFLRPDFENSLQFLRALMDQLAEEEDKAQLKTELQIANWIKNTLFAKVLAENKLFILIIDQAHELPVQCLEAVNELLGFESGSSKLLQIVLFGREDLEEGLAGVQGLKSKTAVYCRLERFSFQETVKFIFFKIFASTGAGERPIKITWPALLSIYAYTRGNPAKIDRLCRQTLVQAAEMGRVTVNRELVLAGRSYAENTKVFLGIKGKKKLATALGISVWLVLLLMFWFSQDNKDSEKKNGLRFEANMTVAKVQPFEEKLGKNSSSGSQKKDRGSIESGKNRTAKEVKKLEKKAPAESKEAGLAKREKQGVEKKLSQESNLEKEKGPAQASKEKERQAKSEQKRKKEEFSPVEGEFGKIRIKKYDNLWKMARRIYNVQDKKFLNREVMEEMTQANQHIKDLGRLKLGSEVVFPVIDKLISKDGFGVWIRLYSSADLQKSYRKFQEFVIQKVPVFMLARQSQGQDLRFCIFYDKLFSSFKAAEGFVSNLPKRYGQKSRIEDLGREGDSFFSKFSKKCYKN